MQEPSARDIEIAKAFKRGVSMLDLALQYDTTYNAIQAAVRRVMITQGEYSK